MRKKLLVALFLAFGMFAVVQAQQGRGGFGGGGGVSQYVTVKAVQEELKMDDAQVTKVTEWSKGFKDTSKKIREDKGVVFEKGNKGKIEPEMMEKIAAANAEISKVAYKELGDVLKKEQIERLKQIDRQAMSVNAFIDAEVVAALKLEDSQKTSIKGLSADLAKDTREIMSEAGFGGGNKGNFDKEKMADAQKKVQKIQKEYIGKAVDVLNDEQKKTWKGLIGEAFDTTKLAGGGGRKKD
jgi:hypothetical protein